MDIIVKKFGGTSLADVNIIKKVAKSIADSRELDENIKIIIVVSAMAGRTNELIDLVNEASLFPEASEYDLVVASGEQVSCGLLSIALNDIGIKARSFMPWQIDIRTDDNHINAKYKSINNDKILDELKKFDVLVVPGFQGVDSSGNRITTIGRGGSDVTAVAVAKAVGAKSCEIYTDVSGVYSSNPKIVKDAKLIASLGYEEMLELSSLGAKVLHPRAVSLGMEYNVPIKILNTFDFISGSKKESGIKNVIAYTNISDDNEKESDQNMETKKIKAVIHSNDFCLIRLVLKNNDINIGDVIDELEMSGVLINSVNQVYSKDGDIEITLITPRDDGKRAFNILGAKNKGDDIGGISILDGHSMISIVGSNINNDSKVLKIITEINQRYNIKPVNMLSTPTRISMFIDEEFGELVTRILHDKLVDADKKITIEHEKSIGA